MAKIVPELTYSNHRLIQILMESEYDIYPCTTCGSFTKKHEPWRSSSDEYDDVGHLASAELPEISFDDLEKSEEEEASLREEIRKQLMGLEKEVNLKIEEDSSLKIEKDNCKKNSGVLSNKVLANSPVPAQESDTLPLEDSPTLIINEDPEEMNDDKKKSADNDKDKNTAGLEDETKEEKKSLKSPYLRKEDPPSRFKEFSIARNEHLHQFDLFFLHRCSWGQHLDLNSYAQLQHVYLY